MMNGQVQDSQIMLFLVEIESLIFRLQIPEHHMPYGYSIPISFKAFHKTGFALKVVQQHILSLQPLLTPPLLHLLWAKVAFFNLQTLLILTKPGHFDFEDNAVLTPWPDILIKRDSRQAKIYTVHVQNPLWSMIMCRPMSTSFSVQLQCGNNFNLNTTLIEI